MICGMGRLLCYECLDRNPLMHSGLIVQHISYKGVNAETEKS